MCVHDRTGEHSQGGTKPVHLSLSQQRCEAKESASKHVHE